MGDTKKIRAIAVMTAHGPERILREGGSQAWVLNPTNALKNDFLVTVQNRHNGTWGGATEQHGAAFLIGRISGVVPTAEKGSKKRYLIQISEYARINVPHGWTSRNPVRYITLDELGIDPDQLEFQAMPAAASEDRAKGGEHSNPLVGMAAGIPEKPRFLTIPEAKEGLAATLGVSIDKIEIIIKA